MRKIAVIMLTLAILSGTAGARPVMPPTEEEELLLSERVEVLEKAMVVVLEEIAEWQVFKETLDALIQIEREIERLEREGVDR